MSSTSPLLQQDSLELGMVVQVAIPPGAVLTGETVRAAVGEMLKILPPGSTADTTFSMGLAGLRYESTAPESSPQPA